MGDYIVSGLHESGLHESGLDKSAPHESAPHEFSAKIHAPTPGSCLNFRRKFVGSGVTHG